MYVPLYTVSRDRRRTAAINAGHADDEFGPDARRGRLK
jgi:hypothetical protein